MDPSADRECIHLKLSPGPVEMRLGEGAVGGADEDKGPDILDVVVLGLATTLEGVEEMQSLGLREFSLLTSPDLPPDAIEDSEKTHGHCLPDGEEGVEGKASP